MQDDIEELSKLIFEAKRPNVKRSLESVLKTYNAKLKETIELEKRMEQVKA